MPALVPTHESRQPGYRGQQSKKNCQTRLSPALVYTIDPDTYQIIDSKTYIADLSKAAEWDRTGAQPTWFFEYSASGILSVVEC